jgi:hypothetical protein
MIEMTMMNGPLKTFLNILGGLAIVLTSFWIIVLLFDKWSTLTQSNLYVAMKRTVSQSQMRLSVRLIIYGETATVG